MTRANSRLPVLSAEVKLAIFFGGTFVWTWVFYLPIALGGHSPYEMPWLGLLIFGGAGPSIVGIVMVLGTWPRSLWPEFLARCFALVRIDRVSWAVVALLVPSIYAVAIWLGTAFGVPLPGAAKAEALYGQPWLWLPALFVSFMSGPWSEEFGWRGFALDLLLERSGLLVGSIGLGIVWSLWHLPLYFMPGTWLAPCVRARSWRIGQLHSGQCRALVDHQLGLSAQSPQRTFGHAGALRRQLRVAASCVNPDCNRSSGVRRTLRDGTGPLHVLAASADRRR